MFTLPPCPKCATQFTYPDDNRLLSPDCALEWPAQPDTPTAESEGVSVRDAVGNALQDGDSGVLVKDLKVKGSSTTLKMGTKVKSIRIVAGDHEVDCRLDGGSFLRKAAFLRKA